MKKRTKWIIGGVLIISLIVVSSVYAFKKGNVDGVWGTIDPLQNLDIIGKIGENPGAGWGSENLSTYNATIRRNANICYGDTDGSNPFDLSGYTGSGTIGDLTGLGSHSATCNGNDLIISEYVHVASSGQRAIEIYNPSDYAISLLGYKIQIYYDGSSTVGRTIELTTNVTLQSHDVWVVSHDTISGKTDQRNTNLDFTGNDVVALVRGGAAGSDYTGAECDNWATGPTGGTDPNGTPTAWSQTNPGVQTGSNTDWNQVRYGRPGILAYLNDCPSSSDTAGFLLQSGFGFDGVDPTGEDYQKNEPFVLGVFCHYNNPIYSPTDKNKLQSVPLNVTVSGLQCDDGSTPAEGSSMSFTYYMRLDETTNTGVDLEDCPYPSTTPCSDAVFISQPPATQQFTCGYGTSQVKYSIAPLGFMLRNTDGTCPNWNAAQARRDFISNEGATNCGCLYGMITDTIVTEVELLYFNAQPGDGVITLQWATATERDNYGFNLYRATSEDGERTLLNAELIPSLVAPGSPFGAEYEFVDSTAEAGVQYYYWLEDVDIYMLSTLHGPAAAILE